MVVKRALEEQCLFELEYILPQWKLRGLPLFKTANCCIRTDPREDKTHGFFVACFKRKASINLKEEQKIEENEDENEIKEYEENNPYEEQQNEELINSKNSNILNLKTSKKRKHREKNVEHHPIKKRKSLSESTSFSNTNNSSRKKSKKAKRRKNTPIKLKK